MLITPVCAHHSQNKTHARQREKQVKCNMTNFRSRLLKNVSLQRNILRKLRGEKKITSA